MTTFPCFASSFDFFTDSTVTNVSQIISDFQARVTGQSPAWTNPSAGVFVSPVDGVGRFMTLTMVATSSTQLTITVTDQNNVTIITRSIEINSTGNTTVNYYTGQFHAWIESFNTAGGGPGGAEVFQAGILDETPLAQNAIPDYVWANAFRNSGGSNDGQGSTVSQEFMLDNGTAQQQQRIRAWGQTVSVGNIGLKDGAGNLQYFPADMFANISGTNRWIGRQYQAYVGDSSIAAGTTRTIPIDTTGLVLGTFKAITGLTESDGTIVLVRVA